MAKSIWDVHHDETLHKEFDKKPAKDPLPAKRAQIMRGIDKAIEAFQKGTKSKANWYKSKDAADGVRVQVSLGTTPLVIDGRSEGTTNDAVAFFKDAKDNVESKRWDAAIREAMEASGKGGRKVTASAAPSERGSMAPELVYRRNVKNLGQKRADELLDKNVKEKGWNKDEVLKAYKELPPLD